MIEVKLDVGDVDICDCSFIFTDCVSPRLNLSRIRSILVFIIFTCAQYYQKLRSNWNLGGWNLIWNLLGWNLNWNLEGWNTCKCIFCFLHFIRRFWNQTFTWKGRRWIGVNLMLTSEESPFFGGPSEFSGYMCIVHCARTEFSLWIWEMLVHLKITYRWREWMWSLINYNLV